MCTAAHVGRAERGATVLGDEGGAKARPVPRRESAPRAGSPAAQVSFHTTSPTTKIVRMPASLKHPVGSLRAPDDERGDVTGSGRGRRQRAPRWLAIAVLATTILAPASGIAAGAPIGVDLPTSFAATDLPTATRAPTASGAPGHSPATTPPAAPHTLAATTASEYVDTCGDADGDAFDLRRVGVSSDGDTAEVSVAMCPGHPDLGSFGDRLLLVQTRTTNGPTAQDRQIELTATAPDTFVVRTYDVNPILGNRTPISGPPATAGFVRTGGVWPRLVLQFPVADLGLGACDPEAQSACLRFTVDSFGSTGSASGDGIPNTGAPTPSWPANCPLALSQAQAGAQAPRQTSRLHVVTAPAAAARVADALLAAGHAAEVVTGTDVVEVATGGHADTIAALQARADVVEVTPAPGRRPSIIAPDDPRWADQWYLRRTGLPTAWETTTGSADTTIAIIDDGVDATRGEFLRGGVSRVRTGFDAIIESDAADSLHVLPAATSSDLGGHGTAVASVAAATGNDGAGMAGVAWDVDLVPVRVFDHEGCFASTNGYLEALDWLVERAQAGEVDVVNLSLGGEELPGEADAIGRLTDAGALVVAATGNQADTSGAAPSYPAAFPEVIAVSATTPTDEVARYANRGRHVDLTAPGGDQSSTTTGDILVAADPTLVGTEYDVLAGTSFSTPMVSGIAALYRSVQPAATPADITRALIGTATDLATGPGGHDTGIGFGIVDAPAVLTAPTGVLARRVAGTNRYETAAAASRTAFRTPAAVDVVLLATGLDFPDALAGGPLAAREHAPLLLTLPDRIPDATLAEIDRLGPSRVLLLGGTSAIGAGVADTLAARGLEVDRVAGADRYETAAQAAIGRFTVPTGSWNRWTTSDVVYVATGAGFADALAGGAAAAAFGAPLLLTPPDRLPDSTATALDLLQPSIVVVLGGEAAVSAEVASAIADRASRPAVVRAAGDTRYETAAVASCPIASLCVGDTRYALAATGADFADALGGAAAAAALRAPLLLAPPSSPAPTSVTAGLLRLEPEQLLVLGGTGAITEAVVSTLAQTVVR